MERGENSAAHYQQPNPDPNTNRSLLSNERAIEEDQCENKEDTIRSKVDTIRSTEDALGACVASNIKLDPSAEQ